MMHTSIIELGNHKSIKQILKRYRISEIELIAAIVNRFNEVLIVHPEKIKAVGNLRYQSKILYEFKLPYQDQLSFRVAFVEQESSRLIVYISTTLLKKAFIREMQKSSLGS